MLSRDIILTINIVEPGLVKAIYKHGMRLGKDLKGLVLIDSSYANNPHRSKDTSGLFKEIVCNFDNPDELQTTIKPYTDRLLAVTCRSETAIYRFRELVPFLPYIFTPSETALQWSTEKALMRDCLRNFNNELVPRYKYFEQKDFTKLQELIHDFKFPVIVKPTALAESLLVSRCETYQELETCLYQTLQIIDQIYTREHRLAKPSILIEEMMDGEMYSTDAYVTHDGKVFCLPLVKVITAHAIGLPGFYSYRHIIPVVLSEDQIQAAFTASISAIRALNLSATTTHIELFLTAHGWKIIEVGARMGGYREALYREAYGVDHYYNDLAIRMGILPQMPAAAISNAAGINIYADQEGYIEAIEGIDEARKVGSVVALEEHAHPGDLALFANNGGQLIVDGILSNTDQMTLEQDVAKVRELVKIKIKEV